MSTINAGTTLTTALSLTGNTDGTLDFATGGTVHLTLTSGGNLNFAGTAQRITGDFANATQANRLAFQSSTANTNTPVNAIPNGSATGAGFRGYGASDPTNAPAISVFQVGTTDSRISSEIYGTASYTPMTFYTSGAEKARLTTTGNFLVGTTTDVSGVSGVISDVAGNVRAIPQTGAVKTSAYTLSISDVGEYVQVGTSGSVVVPNGVFSNGDVVLVVNNTTGNISIDCPITTAYAAGTNTDRASLTLATRGVANVLFLANSICIVSGNVT
jgi:hypothetical protein